MSAILLLVHLLPPSAQGRKRPGKMSASQAVDNLIKFIKVQHVKQLLKFTLRLCKATGSVGALDELFKAHYVLGTSYSSCLTDFFTFLQTTIYNIDVGETKETPRVASKNGALVLIQIK